MTLLDLEPPIFTSCPSDVVVAANDTLAVGVATWADPVATDNREVAEVVSTNAWANHTYPLLPPGAAPVAVAESEWRPTGVTDNAQQLQQQHAGGGGVGVGWAEPRLAWDNATASYAFGTHVVGMVFED